MRDGVGFAQRVAMDDGIGRIKISIPSFNGKAEPEEYLEWEMRVEQIFDSHHYTEDKKIRLATIEFTGYALVWWNQLCRVGARPNTWVQLKNILRRRFVPAHYTRTLYNRLQQLRQGNSSVDEYYKEMEMLIIRTGTEEHDEATIARFFNGLNEDVQDRVEMVHYYNIQDLVHQAERAEQQLKRKQAKGGHANTQTNPWRRPSQQGDDVGSHSKVATSSRSNGALSKEASNRGKEATKSDSSTFSTARTGQIECFKCKGRGHMMRDCPNARKVLLTHEGYATEGESEESEHDDEKFNDSPQDVVYCDPEVGPTLMTHKVDGDNKLIVEKGQRRGVFQT